MASRENTASQPDYYGRARQQYAQQAAEEAAKMYSDQRYVSNAETSYPSFEENPRFSYLEHSLPQRPNARVYSGEYGYGPEQRERQQYFLPASNLGYDIGGRAHTHLRQGYGNVQYFLSASHDAGDHNVRSSTHRRQLPAQGSQKRKDHEMDEYTYSSPSQQTHHSRPPYSITIQDEDPEEAFSEGQSVSSADASPTKLVTAKVTKPKPATAESVDEDLNEDKSQMYNSDEDYLFVTDDSEEAGESSEDESEDERYPRLQRPYLVKKRAGGKTSGRGDGRRRRHRRGRPNSGAIIDAPTFKKSEAKSTFSRMQEALKKSSNAGKDSELFPVSKGREPRWETHAEPKLVPVKTLTAGQRKKLGIKKDFKGDMVCLRPTGSNDPENIDIVNMKDVEGKTFKEIADIINARRVNTNDEKKPPNQTANSINCRYNRTAPKLWQMQGKMFIRVCDRANLNGQHKYTKAEEDMIWEDDDDLLLVELEHYVRKQKWHKVAELFAANHKDGWNPSALECAQRFEHL